MNPIRHTTRALVRMLRRSFDAATGGSDKRWPSWASQYAPARQQLAARHQLSSRASYQIANSPTGASVADQWVTNLVGDGPSVRSGHPSKPMREALEDSFSRWSEDVDVAGGGDLAGFLNGSVRSIVGAGEAVAHMVTTPRGELRLRLASPEQLDPSRTRELEDMTKIIAGVEFDVSGRIVAYHIYPNQPDLFVTMAWAPIRIPAEDVLHTFEAKTPGQVRGTSWLAPVMTTILQIDQLQDALLARANTAALFGAFVTDPSGTSGFGAGARDPQQLGLEPGVLRLLPPDATVVFPNMPTSEGTPELLKHLLRAVAAGTGLPCELLTGDLSSTNYSSAKLGLEAFKRRCKAIRETLLVARLLRPIWRRWVTLEILSGRLYAPDFERDPSPYFAASFLFPEWASLDPYREAQADVTLLNAGIRSRAEIIAARGRDVADVDAEIASDTFTPRGPAQPGQQLLENANAP